MTSSTGAAVRLHRNAVRHRPDSLSAFKWKACPPSPESAGHTQGLEDLAIEMLARGLSVRDIEDAFKDETGRLLLSKTAVSQLGKRLWQDYRAFTQRDLSEYEITYLFVDGIAERLRPGAKREPVLAAWGFTIEVRRVLLHMMAGELLRRCLDGDRVVRGYEELMT
jgi:hypothetical protein